MKGDDNEDSEGDGDGGDDYDFINRRTCPINTQQAEAQLPIRMSLKVMKMKMMI